MCFPRYRLTEEQETLLLIFIHGVANTAIGLALMFFSNLSAENVLAHYIPYWLWPFMFIIAGLAAFIGMVSRAVAQFAFIFAAIVMFIFGCASLYASVTVSTAALSTTVFLFYMTIMKLYLSRFIRQRDDTVKQINETTEYAQSVLDKTTDGTTDS